VYAIQKSLPIAYRAKVLGRALVAARLRTNANSFWMLEYLSSTTAVTTLAGTNLHTRMSVTAAATSNAAVAVTATLAAAGASTAAANVATIPANCPKRKARPSSHQGFIKTVPTKLAS
jgi:hypothetical protein